MFLGIVLFALILAAVLWYLKDTYLVVCPQCRSVNRSERVFSSDSLKTGLRQQGFQWGSRPTLVSERYHCRKCGGEFERTVRKQGSPGNL